MLVIVIIVFLAGVFSVRPVSAVFSLPRVTGSVLASAAVKLIPPITLYVGV